MGKVKWYMDLYEEDLLRKVIETEESWLIHDGVEWLEVRKREVKICLSAKYV